MSVFSDIRHPAFTPRGRFVIDLKPLFVIYYKEKALKGSPAALRESFVTAYKNPLFLL